MDGKNPKIIGTESEFFVHGIRFYEHYHLTFENTVLCKMKKLLPPREMEDNFGLVSNRRSSKRGPKPYVRPIVRGKEVKSVEFENN